MPGRPFKPPRPFEDKRPFGPFVKLENITSGETRKTFRVNDELFDWVQRTPVINISGALRQYTAALVEMDKVGRLPRNLDEDYIREEVLVPNSGQITTDRSAGTGERTSVRLVQEQADWIDSTGISYSQLSRDYIAYLKTLDDKGQLLGKFIAPGNIDEVL